MERPQDIVVVERTQEFRGLYHVLGGSLSPINGVGPGQLRIGELRERLDREGIEELIVATNPTVEGDATAMYLARELKPLGGQGHPARIRPPRHPTPTLGRPGGPDGVVAHRVPS